MEIVAVIISFCSLLFSIYVWRKQYRLSREIGAYTRTQTIDKGLDDIKAQFLKIHKDLFGILTENQNDLCKRITIQIAEKIYNKYDQRRNEKPLRHAYYELCQVISFAFEKEITWQTPIHLSSRIQSAIDSLNIVYNRSKPFLRDPSNVYKWATETSNSDHQLNRLSFCRQRYHLIQSAIPKDEYNMVIKTIHCEYLEPFLSTVDKLSLELAKIEKELSWLEIAAKNSTVALVNNQSLYWNFKLLLSTVGWLREIHELISYFGESRINQKDNLFDISEYTLFVGSVSFLTSYLIHSCINLNTNWEL